MNIQMKRWSLAVLLALALVLSLAACGEPTETTAPEVTEPEVTEPEVTEPEGTEPEVTEPEVTEPAETLPEETLPAETEPEETLPAETEGDDGHRHKFTSAQTLPNCVEPGRLIYSCECGETYALEGDEPLGHAWVPTETVPSTCAVAGYDAFACVSCGATEARPLPLLPHDLSVSCALYSAADVQEGNGFELLGCSACRYMLKVDANHASGHNFTVGDDGAIRCACGAVAEVKDTAIGSMDFTTDAQGKGISITNGVKISDGKWVVSNSTGQSFLHYNKNPELATALAGFDAKGNTVKELTISFEISYTGEYRKDLNFLHLLNADGWAASIYLGNENGKMMIYGGAGTAGVVAEPEEIYLVKFVMIPAEQRIYATVESESLTEAVLLFDKTVKRQLADSTQFGLARADFRCSESESYAIYVDNLAIDSVIYAYDPENAGCEEICEHTFTKALLNTVEHPLADEWFRYTCTACERYYEEPACELAAGHILSITPADVAPSTCVTQGTATYTCLVCGETVYETLPFADHAFTISTAVIPASAFYRYNGFEIMACRDCDVLTLAEANHESGHRFLKNEEGRFLCACGAEISATLDTFATMDFTSQVQGNGMYISGGVSAADGKWVVSNSSNQAFLHYDKNPVLAQALSGLDADGRTVESVAIAFELTYTGTYNKDANFINLLGTDGFLAAIHFGTDGEGHMALYDGGTGNKVVLTAGETYLVKFILMPGAEKLAASVEGGDFAAPVTIFETAAKESLSRSKQFGLSRPAFKCGEGESYVIEVDNMSISRSILSDSVIDGDTSGYCDHILEAELLEDGAVRCVCLVCERAFERAACAEIGHVLLAEILDGEPSSCVVNGYETHECLWCGELVDIELPLVDHVMPTLPTESKPSTCSEAGYNAYKCANCEYTETEELSLLPHAYGKLTAVVSKANDPVGEGYELWACACGYETLKKIVGNHESGHFFVDNVCACGATVAEETTSELLGAFDFSNTTGTGGIVFTQFPDIVGGEWVISNAWRQHFIKLENNATLKKALSGTDANGKKVDAVEVSFKLKYTGTYGNTKAENFMHLLNADGWAASIYFVGVNGKLALFDGASGAKTSLTAGQTYTVRFIMYPATNGFKATVEGGDLANTVTLLQKTINKKLAEATQLGFSRAAFKCSDGSYTITADDLALTSYRTETVVNESAVDTTDFCAHSFTKTPIVDDDHEADDKWYSFECSVCGRGYTAQESKNVVLGAFDFSSSSMTSGDLKLTGATPVIEDGKFRISSLSHGRTFITKDNNSTFAGLLDGVDDDGDRVSLIKFSFDLSFDGKLAFSAADSGNNYVFIGLNENAGFTVAIQLRADKDGNAVVCGADKKTSLTLYAGKVYTFDWYMNPNNGRMYCMVSGEDMAQTLLFDVTRPTAFSTFVQLVVGRESTYYSASDYAIYLDDLSIAYDKVAD